MSEPRIPQQAPFPSSRSQQARAFVRNRLVNIQLGPVCSCHPGGRHPVPEDIATRETQRLIRRR